MNPNAAYPEHFKSPHLRSERRIVDTIITHALATGYLISVFDGEEWALGYSSDYTAITREIAATDLTTLRFRRANEAGRPVVGSVMLVHGNDTDVIFNYSDNDDMQRILAPAIALANALAAA